MGDIAFAFAFAVLDDIACAKQMATRNVVVVAVKDIVLEGS